MSNSINAMEGEPNSERLILYRNRYNDKGHLVGMEAIEERKTGHWIVYPAPDEQHCGLVKCPYCREELIAEPTEYHYCPSCGAKLEVEHE